jgi:hypothetical protein
MNSSDDFSDLISPLAAWTADATRYIYENLQECTVVPSSNVWVHVSDSEYQRATPPLMLKPESESKLKELPSYLTLDRLARQSSALSPMLDRMVGTHRSGTRFSTWTLAKAFLPKINDLINGCAPTFAQRYEVVSKQFSSRDVEYKAICPIQGVGFETSPIRLADGLVIERMSPVEICRALEVSAIPLMFFDTFRPDESNSFALKKKITVPVYVREARSQEAAPTLIDPAELRSFMELLTAFEDVMALQQCLALMTEQRVQISAVVTVAEDEGFLGIDPGTDTRPISGNLRQDSGLRFDSSKCVDLQQIWTAFHESSLPQNRSLGLAMRRLTFATQRGILEDRLLDVFIAAEAFYRSGSVDRRNQRVRRTLAERAAAWSEGTFTGWTQNEVLEQMKKSYDVRSAVAHGDEPKKNDLQVKGQPANLNELVRATEAIVRDGIYKAIRQLGNSPDKKLSIPWEELVRPRDGDNEEFPS